MNLTEAQNYLCSKLNISPTDVINGNNALFSLTDINQYIFNGLKRAWDYKPWTFTEKTYIFVLNSDFFASGYFDYPNNFEDLSIYRLEVEGVAEFEKKNFADYQKWFVDYPNNTDRIWSEHERFVFLNTFAVSLGQSVDFSGKLRPPHISDGTDLLPFSPMTDTAENSGNMAIVLLAYADALNSEKKKNLNAALAQEKIAFSILDNVWKPMGERKAKEQQQNRPFFSTRDLFNSRGPNRSDTNIANFP